jgi:DNA polymerase III alpha subunit
MDSHVDDYGRVAIDFSDIAEVLYEGLPPRAILVSPSVELDAFNARCEDLERPEYKLGSPEPLPYPPTEEHARRSASWLICEDLRDLDVRAFVRSLCSTPEQIARVDHEMDLFEGRGLVPLLQTMICLVDHFRTNEAVWGVGRGSSVASYVLFLIGVHRIDSMRYGLQIEEFLKD